jgi:tricorn protease
VPKFAFYDDDGTWAVEGHGVDPDIEVIDDPTLLARGEDPQLDAAIEWVMTEIEANPPVKIAPVPPYPDRSGSGIPERDW